MKRLDSQSTNEQRAAFATHLIRNNSTMKELEELLASADIAQVSGTIRKILI